MNLKKLSKRLLSLLIVSVMLVGVAAPIVSAATYIDHLHKNNAGDGTLHYVSLGGSNTNGYGHAGFLPESFYNDPVASENVNISTLGYLSAPDTSYPVLVKNALAQKTGREVELHQLAMSLMRVEEVLYLLDESFESDSYMNSYFTNGTDGWVNVAGQGGIPALRQAYVDYVSNADVISVDLGWNNFSVHALNNIKTILATGDYWMVPNINQVLNGENVEEYNTIRSMVMDILVDQLSISDSVLSAKLEKIADTLAYTVFSSCYNFDKVISTIYTLNPDVNVVVLNIQNVADGLTFEIDGQTLPLGDIYGELIEFVDLYRASLSPSARKYSFAIAGENGNVDTFLDDILEWGGNSAFLSQSIKDYFDVYDSKLCVRSIIEYIMVGEALGNLFKTVRDMGANHELSILVNDTTYTYEFAFDKDWLDDLNFSRLNLQNPSTDFETYAAGLSKHLINIKSFESSGKNAYNYVFDDLSARITLRKTQLQLQKYDYEEARGGLIATRDIAIANKLELEEQLKQTTDPDSIAAIADRIEQYEENIASYNEDITKYDVDIASAEATIGELSSTVENVIPVMKQVFDNGLAGIYEAYQKTLSYSYGIMANIVQYVANIDTVVIDVETINNLDNATSTLLSYFSNSFFDNAQLKFQHELWDNGVIGGSEPERAPTFTINESIFDDSSVCMAATLALRCEFANGLILHPSVEGSKQIKNAIINALENGSDADAFTEIKIKDYIGALEDALNPYYEEKYAELKANGTIDQMIGKLDDFDAIIDSFESSVLNYQASSNVDPARAESIKQLLLDEIANIRVSSVGLRALLNMETLDFGSMNYADLVKIYRNFENHITTIGKLSLEIAYMTDSYILEIKETITSLANLINEISGGAYYYLVNGIEEFNTKYLEFVELAGACADRIDPLLGQAVRNYLIDTPNDAINIICAYGDEALFKLIVDATVAINGFSSSMSAIFAILVEHGEDIYSEIVADDEYKALVETIQRKNEDLIKLYQEAMESPFAVATNVNEIIKREAEELKNLYVQLVKLVAKNVEAYDSEVAELLRVAILDVADEIDLLIGCGETYLTWFGDHTYAMLGALLHSFLGNTSELGAVTYEVLQKHVEAFKKLDFELRDEVINSMVEKIKFQLEEIMGLKIDSNLDSVIFVELISMIDDIKGRLDDAFEGEYTPGGDSYYVAITGDDSVYAELIAGALGLSDKHSVMGWNSIDKNLLNKADFVTIGYDRTQISGFVAQQLLASLSAYGNDSFREQVRAYLDETLTGELSDERVAEIATAVDNVIVSILEDSALSNNKTTYLDWSSLLGNQEVAQVSETLSTVANFLQEKGITGEYTLKINVKDFIEKYLPGNGISVDIFNKDPIFELKVPVAQMIMLAIESYLYANIEFQMTYTKTIFDLVAANPDVQIAVLGQYNPFKDITFEGIDLPLATIYDEVIKIANLDTLVHAMVLPNVTYIDISNAKTSWSLIDDPLEFLNAYLSNPMGDMFTNSSNRYIMSQVLNAYGLSCIHDYIDCEDGDCGICGENRQHLGHSYNAVVTQPGCTTAGFTTYTCTKCGDSFVNNYTVALGHQYFNACDPDCARCGEQRTPSDHNFGDWIIVVVPTKDTEGKEMRVCSICGYVETRITNEVPGLTTSEILAIVFGSAMITFGIGAAVVLTVQRKKRSK